MRWEGHRSSIKALAVASSADRAVSCCARFLRLWQVSTGKCLQVVDLERTFPRSVSVNQDATLAVVGGGFGEFALVRLSDGDVKIVSAPAGALRGSVRTVATSPDGKFAVGGGYLADIPVLDLRERVEERTLPAADAHTRAEARRIRGVHDPEFFRIDTIAFSTDGSQVIAEGDWLRVIDFSTGLLLRALPGIDGRLDVELMRALHPERVREGRLLLETDGVVVHWTSGLFRQLARASFPVWTGVAPAAFVERAGRHRLHWLQTVG